MAVEVTTQNGKKITLLNPREKGARYREQIKNKCIMETGKVLSAEEIKYRQGYLQSLNDTMDVYLSKTNKPLLKEVRRKRWLKFKAWLASRGIKKNKTNKV